MKLKRNAQRKARQLHRAGILARVGKHPTGWAVYEVGTAKSQARPRVWVHA